MAAISLRNDVWQARIRRKGHPTVTRSFATRRDAEKWARSIETAMDRGSYSSGSEAQRTTLGEVIARYVVEVLPSFKSAREDEIRLKALLRHPLCRHAMAWVSPHRVAQYRDERLKEVSPATVIRELAYLSAIINHARREWAILVENPVASVRKPSSPPGRDRVLSEEEETHLLEALRPAGRRNGWMQPLVVLALETAMRRGELLALRWEDVNLANRVAILHTTKNGDSRVVPLSSKAAHVLRDLPRSITGRVFPLQAFSVAAAFKRFE